MGPALRDDLALGGLLDPVVADRGGRVQRLVNVRLGELDDQRPARVRIRGGGRVVGPDAGKQSACNSSRTDALCGPSRSPPTLSMVPSRFWTWWPYSCATTYRPRTS